MPVVTYLLGAGASTGVSDFKNLDASATAIPMGVHLRDDLSRFMGALKSLKDDSPGLARANFNAVGVRDHLIQILEQIHRGLESSTIDAFIKKRVLTGTDIKEIRDYKIAIASAFKFWQFTRPLDKRYLDFFTNVLTTESSGKLLIPNTIRIVTWNYDLQLEHALKEFLSPYENEEQLAQICPSQLAMMQKYDPGKFGVFHLNGTCHRHNQAESDQKKEIVHENDLKRDEKDPTDVLLSILTVAFALTQRPSLAPSISYAWEKRPSYHEYRDHLKNSLVDTEAVVVIGYSFPFFNRSVDKEVFSYMSKLKKVYLQVPLDDQNEYRNRLLSTIGKEVEVVSISEGRQFYIPYEFSI